MNKFITIGENIHTTRIVKRAGIRAHVFSDGNEAIKYIDDGEFKYVKVPNHFTNTQPYQQGNLKHFMIAVWKGMNDSSEEARKAIEYINFEVKRQEKYGASYLDLNVDEISHRLEEQKNSIKWLVETVQKVANIPISVDSSNPEIIEAGLSVYKGIQGRVMLNSIALERPEALSLAVEYNAKVILSAASESAMPNSAEERIMNINTLIDMSQKKGINIEDIFVDPLIFPISVDPNYVNHALGAIREIRKNFEKIHITGGISNVSFGLPKRKIINEAFLKLAIGEGLDSGIIDPTQLNVKDIKDLDFEINKYKLAKNLLLGNDEFAMNYISAYRSGEL